VGAVLLPLAQGVQVWVRHVNEHGGVSGHLVHHVLYDDGGDPARHRFSLQQAVERQKVVAFVGEGDGVTGRAGVEYINSKRVPVIGSEGAGNWYYESPMYFPQQTSAEGFFGGAVLSIAQQAVPAGKTKFGTIVCVESTECDRLQQAVDKYVPKTELEYVYRGRSSIAQPDYTAECLSARNAGTTVLLLVLEAASQSRFGAACARQAFRPLYGSFASAVAARAADDPNLRGMVADSPVFPWFQTGTPATDEFASAFGRYGRGVPAGVGPPTGWVAGKVFEKAAANLSEPPTAAGVLEGLWAFKDDSLGGLTQPLTFVRDQPTKPVVCWFNIKIADEGGKWVSPDGFRQHCDR
jgi:branched-chain amino acid transport system substrate-binding protein